MLDETHLLTVGYDTTGNVQLQIFDVGEAAEPKLAHKLVLGSAYTSSEAQVNHLAFTLFQGKLALPVTLCSESQMTFSGLMLFDVSAEKGFEELGRVAHPASTASRNDLGFEDTGCFDLQVRAQSAVLRSVFMEDYVYSLAPDVMRVQKLDALGSDLAAVKLND